MAIDINRSVLIYTFSVVSNTFVGILIVDKLMYYETINKAFYFFADTLKMFM